MSNRIQSRTIGPFLLFLGLILFQSPRLESRPKTTPTPDFQKLKKAEENEKAVQKEVAQILKMYDQVVSDIRHKKFEEKHSDFGEENLGGSKTLYLDRRGKVRAYYIDYGSEDSLASWKYVYDEGGRLRLVATHAGYVGGNRVEDQKIFLDAEGNVLEVDYKMEEADEETGARKQVKRKLSEPLEVHDMKVEYLTNPKQDFNKNWP